MKAFFIVLVLPIFGFCQKDSIVGKIKSVKEVVVYLDSTRQQPRLFESDGDYGHSGFMNPKAALSNMTSSWYDSYFTCFGSYRKSYDLSGKLTSEIWYYKNGEEYTRYVYSYDKLHNLVEEKRIDTFDQSYYSTKHYFDEYENLKRSTIFYSSDRPSFYGYTNFLYDDNKNLTRIKRFDEYGFSGGKVYKYLENKKLYAEYEHTDYKVVKYENGVTAYVRDSIGEIILRAKFKYGSDGNIIEKQLFNEGKITGAELRKYDNKGRLIETMLPSGAIHSIHYNKIGLVDRRINSYKAEKDSTVRTIHKYLYDKSSNIKRVELFSDGQNYILEFDYIFDSQKNWIKQTKTVNGKMLYVRQREIEYY